MILDTGARSLEVVLGEAEATAGCDITASYAVSAPGSFTPALYHTASNGIAAVTVVPAPDYGGQAQVSELRVHNNDSIAHSLTLSLNDGGTYRVLLVGLVNPDGDWVYTPGVGVVSGGGGSYTLPTATAAILGGVKPDGTTIGNTGGAIHVTYGTAANTAAQGNDSRITGALSAATAASTYYLQTNPAGYQTAANVTAAIAGAAYTLPAATAATLGGVKPDGTTIANVAGAVSVTYGTAAGTAAQGNDSRITGALSAATAASTYYLQTNPSGYQTAAQVSTTVGTETTRATAAEALLAPLVSPVFTTPTLGIALATGPGLTDSSGRVATSNFVQLNLAPGWNNAGRNLLHNPSFNIQQRGAGPFTTAGYGPDRWVLSMSTSTVSLTVAAASDADRTAIGDEGILNYAQFVVGGTAGAGDFALFQQAIESVRRTSNKSVAMQFWAKVASGTAKIGLELIQSFGGGGSPSANVTSIGSQQFSLTTTWTKFSAIIAVPSVSGKTFGTTPNTDYLLCRFWLTAGATFTTEAGGIPVQSPTIQLTNTQLEVSSIISVIEKRDPVRELANCQRFYQIGQIIQAGYGLAGNAVFFSSMLPVAMRAAPTVTPAIANLTNCTGLSGGTYGGYAVWVSASVTATAGFILSATFTASAEL